MHRTDNARRSRHDDVDWALPFAFEVFFWAVGVVAGILSTWWLTNRMTAPVQRFAETFNVTVDAAPIVDACWPLLVMFGLLVAAKVRGWCRRAFVRQLDRSLAG